MPTRSMVFDRLINSVPRRTGGPRDGARDLGTALHSLGSNRPVETAPRVRIPTSSSPGSRDSPGALKPARILSIQSPKAIFGHLLTTPTPPTPSPTPPSPPRAPAPAARSLL